MCKRPYQLGDFGKIGAMICAIIGGRRPIIAPTTPCVWPKIAGQSLGDHRHWPTGDRRPISRMFDISLPTGRLATSQCVCQSSLVGKGLNIHISFIRVFLSHIDLTLHYAKAFFLTL